MTNDQMAYLQRYGIDYAEAMDRFGGNEDLFVRLATKYLNDPHFHALEAAMAEGDAAAGEREAHSLKGVAGNLSFTQLYDLATRITDALRSDDLAGAQALMPELKQSHEAVSKRWADWRKLVSLTQAKEGAVSGAFFYVTPLRAPPQVRASPHLAPAQHQAAQALPLSSPRASSQTPLHKCRRSTCQARQAQ